MLDQSPLWSLFWLQTFDGWLENTCCDITDLGFGHKWNMQKVSAFKNTWAAAIFFELNCVSILRD